MSAPAASPRSGTSKTPCSSAPAALAQPDAAVCGVGRGLVPCRTTTRIPTAESLPATKCPHPPTPANLRAINAQITGTRALAALVLLVLLAGGVYWLIGTTGSPLIGVYFLVLAVVL